jgi:hypothetical protein
MSSGDGVMLARILSRKILTTGHITTPSAS